VFEITERDVCDSLNPRINIA